MIELIQTFLSFWFIWFISLFLAIILNFLIFDIIRKDDLSMEVNIAVLFFFWGQIFMILFYIFMW